MARNMTPESLPEELQSKIAEAAGVEDAAFTDIAPRGQFTRNPLNSLVKSLNKVLPVFGIKDVYPTFDADVTEFPVDFVKQIGMIQTAVADAVTAEVLTPEHSFTLEEIVDDRAVTLVSGKLDMLSRSKDFKRFLAEPREAPVEEMEDAPSEDTEMSDDDLFMSRIN